MPANEDISPLEKYEIDSRFSSGKTTNDSKIAKESKKKIRLKIIAAENFYDFFANNETV